MEAEYRPVRIRALNSGRGLALQVLVKSSYLAHQRENHALQRFHLLQPRIG
jgi:hypothetical protein